MPTLPDADKLDDDEMIGSVNDDNLDAQLANNQPHDENRPAAELVVPRDSSERSIGRPRKRRKLIVDEATTISGDEMKANMANYE